jgi:AAA15 family ATPase/GTPase
MVSSVKISNFRGFKQLEVNDLTLINIVVGDNAMGKTALLEAIFFALSGSIQQPLNLKQWRGQDMKFQTGLADSVMEAVYSDLFHDSKSEEPIDILLKGTGFENRQLKLSRSRGDVIVTTQNVGQQNRKERRAAKKQVSSQNRGLQTISQIATVPILATWTDQYGNDFNTRVLLSPNGLQFEGTNEQLPNCFFYPTQSPIPAAEAASHFSALKKQRQAGKFREVFMSVFEEIKDIDLGESSTGSVLMADVPWAKELLPLPIISGGTNRTAAILLAITHRENGLVMVDEVENGLFHKRQAAFSSALIELSRAYKTQLLMTTHSEEWIENFLDAAGEKTDDITFWRMERIEQAPAIRRFSPSQFKSGLAIGEMR